MTTAWLLPGGSAMGATQVGQAEALLSAGIEPDLLLGASAGSLNAAWLAADPTLHGVDVLRHRWLEVSRRQVFPLAPVTLALGLAGRRDHTVSHAGLRHWLEEHLPYRQIDEARLPLTIATTDLETGEAVYLTRGALIPALLASCALPGVFPPVTVGGRLLVDGGVAADPIGEAVSQGADRIYVLPTLGQSSRTRPKGAFDLLQRAVGLMLGASRNGEIASWADRCQIYLVPCPVLSGASPFSFRRGAELIETARELTTTWLPTARPVAAPSPRSTRLPTERRG
jgi:NTE family protein